MLKIQMKINEILYPIKLWIEIHKCKEFVFIILYILLVILIVYLADLV